MNLMPIFYYYISQVIAPGLGMTSGQWPAPTLSPMQIKKKDAWVGDE